MLSRRQFLIVGASAPVVLSLEGCPTAADVEATIQTILNDLPIAIQIAQSIITIIGAVHGAQANPAALAQLSTWSGQIAADLKLAQTLVAQYETNLSSAPATVLGEIDSAIADVNGNLSAIEEAIHVYDPTTQAAIAAAVAAIDTVVLGLESLVPQKVAAQFPRTSAALYKRGKALGAMTKVTVPSSRGLAKGFNAKVAHDFPTAKVSVPPLFHVGGLNL